MKALSTRITDSHPDMPHLPLSTHTDSTRRRHGAPLRSSSFREAGARRGSVCSRTTACGFDSRLISARIFPRDASGNRPVETVQPARLACYRRTTRRLHNVFPTRGPGRLLGGVCLVGVLTGESDLSHPGAWMGRHRPPRGRVARYEACSVTKLTLYLDTLD